MKRVAAALLTILLCIMCVSSLASVVQIPEELKVILDEQNSGDHVLDYIEFTTQDGVCYAFILDSWRLREYQYRDGIWQSARDTDALYDGKALMEPLIKSRYAQAPIAGIIRVSSKGGASG